MSYKATFNLEFFVIFSSIGIKKYIIQKEEQNSVFHAGQTINYMIGNKKIATLRKSKKTNFK